MDGHRRIRVFNLWRQSRSSGYVVWCALLYAASGSWLTWRVGRPLVSMNSTRYQRESEFRFALFQANQQMKRLASLRGEEREKRSLGLEKVVAIVRDIVNATAKLTWVTAGYGWVSIVAPILIASPAYFSTKLSFVELMVVVGAFNQVNQSLRWFVDSFAVLAEWHAALFRVTKFREVLSISENVAPIGKRAVLDVVEVDVARRRVSSRCF
jgi:vitamin B12/bleomycin/antimicrobial peptide transport system ATP-binding/permease protein